MINPKGFPTAKMYGIHRHRHYSRRRLCIHYITYHIRSLYNYYNEASTKHLRYIYKISQLPPNHKIVQRKSKTPCISAGLCKRLSEKENIHRERCSKYFNFSSTRLIYVHTSAAAHHVNVYIGYVSRCHLVSPDRLPACLLLNSLLFGYI